MNIEKIKRILSRYPFGVALPAVLSGRGGLCMSIHRFPRTIDFMSYPLLQFLIEWRYFLGVLLTLGDCESLLLQDIDYI